MQNTVSFPKLGIELSFNNSIKIGSFEIAYYGIIIAIGLILALVYAYKNFRKIGIDPDKATDAIIGGIIGGIVGARLYFVIFSNSEYSLDFSSLKAFGDSLWNIINIRQGGLAIYGGIIGAFGIGVLIAKLRKVNVKGLLDIAGIGFLLGQGIGRWGNFFNVEAFGSNTDLPWGMTGPAIESYLNSKLEYFESIGINIDPTAPVHPCFLYESIWCLIGFILLALYLKRRKFDGEVFLMYLAYYGLGRFFIEGLRTDSLTIGSALRVSQVLAGLCVITAVIVIIVVRSKIKNSNDENYLKLFALTEEGQKIVNYQKDSMSIESIEADATEDNNLINEIKDQNEEEETTDGGENN